jgi:hypothetical protein
LEVRDDDLWVVSFPKTGKCVSSHVKYMYWPACRGEPHIFMFLFRRTKDVILDVSKYSSDSILI